MYQRSPCLIFPFLFFAMLPFCMKAMTDPKPGQFQIDNQGIEVLLSRLDLKGEGLEQVRKSLDNPRKAAEELLTYYRSRTSVKHPIERKLKSGSMHISASKEDIQVADDALTHIFVGQPAYPPHFCGDDIDWSTNPVSDKEWVWQLNRMSFWDAMGRVYWHTGDEKYADAWCKQILDWISKNPNDEDHKYAWRSIEAGIRGYRWTGLFQRFLDAPSFTPDVLIAFLNSCYDHSEYLMTQYRTGSNWGLMEAEGMAFIGITFPEFQQGREMENRSLQTPE